VKIRCVRYRTIPGTVAYSNLRMGRGLGCDFGKTNPRAVRSAVAAQDGRELQPILSELNDSLRKHTERLKNIVAQYPFSPVDTNKPVA
jgi:predicted component of type VI protein secretion system